MTMHGIFIKIVKYMHVMVNVWILFVVFETCQGFLEELVHARLALIKAKTFISISPFEIEYAVLPSILKNELEIIGQNECTNNMQRMQF